MKPQAEDTPLEVEAIQFEMMRRVGSEGRLERMRSFSASVINVSRRAIANRHPAWSEREVLLHWVEVHYGADVADMVRRKSVEKE